MKNSKIEWTDHTFNPWYGCQKVSDGCDNCYAERDVDKRFHLTQWGPHGERRRASEAKWREPRSWARAVHDTRNHPRVFSASWADVFDNQAPDEWRADLFQLIKETPELDWLLLTKRPQNIRKMLPRDWGDGWHNVWLGITARRIIDSAGRSCRGFP
jgi:protein gp37